MGPPSGRKGRRARDLVVCVLHGVVRCELLRVQRLADLCGIRISDAHSRLRSLTHCLISTQSPTARHQATISPASFPGAGGSADRGSIQGWRDAAPRETLPSILVFAASMASTCVEIKQCVGCTRKFFTKSFLGDDAAALARSSGEEPASPRIGQASRR